MDITSILKDHQQLRRCVPLLAYLTDAEIANVAARSSVQRYSRKKRIVEQGTATDAMYFVLTGSAYVIMEDSLEHEAIVSTLFPGDYFGEMSLIDDAPHVASVIAATATEILIVDNAIFRPFLPYQQSVAAYLMRSLVRRLRNADRNIESLSLLDVQGRVARALLDFAVDDGHGDLHIRDMMSMTDLGKMIGASREGVSRVLADFQDRGLIKMDSNGTMLLQAGTSFIQK